MKKFLFFWGFIFIVSYSFAQNYEFKFQSLTPVPTGLKYSTSAWLDANNDGYLDLIHFGEDADGNILTFLYINNRDETFSEISGSSVGLPNLELGAIDTADFNGDGITDIVICGYGTNGSGFTDIFYNNGDTSFTAANAGLAPIYMGDISTCDFNNDGYTDIAILGLETTVWQDTVLIYKNIGDSAFVNISVRFPKLSLGVIKWADINGDSLPDFLMTGYENNFYSKIWLNNGDETFTESSENLYQSWLGDAAWADIDNDGDPDLFLTGVGGSGTERKSILYYNENGHLIDSLNFLGVSHSNVVIADFDNDGDKDIYYDGVFGDGMGSGDYLSKILINNNGLFSDTNVIEFPGIYWGGSSAADLNNDSLVDLFISGSVFKNGNDMPSANFYKAELIYLFAEYTKNNLKVFPVPAGKYLHIEDNSNMQKVIISDMNGKIIYSQFLNSNKSVLELASLPSGIYILTIKDKEGTKSVKFIHN